MVLLAKSTRFGGFSPNAILFALKIGSKPYCRGDRQTQLHGTLQKKVKRSTRFGAFC